MNHLGVGDAVGICTNEDGDLVVDYNSEEVRQATVRPTYGAAAVQHLPPPAPGKAECFTTGQPLSHICLSVSCICVIGQRLSLLLKKLRPVGMITFSTCWGDPMCQVCKPYWCMHSLMFHQTGYKAQT